MAPVVHACARAGVPARLVHTGQHYDRNMTTDFLEALGMREPDHCLDCLDVAPAGHGRQTGRMLEALEALFERVRPDFVLVQGDTNSTLAGGLAAAKLHIPVGHVEAGLRSYDRRMPEEINRIVVDHLASHLFAPTERSRSILRGEGISEERIQVTGNTIVDVVLGLLASKRLEASRLTPLGLQPRAYGLVTAHRAENVDAQERIEALFAALDAVADTFDLDLVYPCHPRTRARLASFGLVPGPRLLLRPPASLLDFLVLERFARIVLTDSGGVQEECCILGSPCVTLRDSTERPEAIEVGANMLAGLDLARVLEATSEMLGRSGGWPNPFGDGHAGDRIVAAIAPLCGAG